MAKLIGNFGSRIVRMLALFAGATAVAVLTVPLAMAEISVTVKDSNGGILIPTTTNFGGFRYIVEEDPTVQVTPPEPGFPDTSPVLGFKFHASHAPVVVSGEATANPFTILDADLCGGTCPTDAGPYFVTVTPFSEYALTAGKATYNGAVELTVNQYPHPTAQISVSVFRDDILNGAPDLPQEIPGTATNSFDPTSFTIIVEEPGGKYGIPGGTVLLDAFGNPLGTSYTDAIVDGAPVVDVMGDGVLTPAPNGVLLIKNLVPAKYGIIVVPPEGEGWQQTSTIEGSKVIDAWVSSDEPPFFVEFGPPGHHVFVGFTQPKQPTGTAAGSISGQIRNNHMSRPPGFAFYSGNTLGDCWVALLPGQGGDPGTSTHVQQCEEDSSFLIQNVAAGLHTLVVFDGALNAVIAQYGVEVGDGVNPVADPLPTHIALSDVPVFNWFGRLDASIFHDANQNGKRDEGEAPIHADKSAVNIRFRDGTVYQSFPVDTEGFAPFDTVFPFFHWLVPEVDFLNLMATGATYWVDDGGPVDLTVGGNDVFNPQAVDPLEATCGSVEDIGDTCTNDDGSRTLRGPVLTLGMQTFLGQTNKIEFGKVAYAEPDVDANGDGDVTDPGDTDRNSNGSFDSPNGGISGIVFYAVTRAEDDPRLAAAEEWEPGIPRVQVNLFQSDGTKFQSDGTTLKTICNSTVPAPAGYRADLDLDGCITEPDIDVYPLAEAPADFPGVGDTDWNLNGTFDYGDAVQVTYTDSWDDNQPENCQGSNGFTAVPDGLDAADLAEANSTCFDGMRNFNQIREAVFDGGYAFDSYLDRDEFGALTGTTVDGLPTNIYVVQAITPPGYTLLREEDRNVDFGDEYVPATFAKTGASDLAIREALGDLPITLDADLDLGAPAACVGAEHLVQDELSYLTLADGTPLPGVDTYLVNPDNEAPYRAQQRRLCDQKVVVLTPGKNSAADFFDFSQAPISANVVGGILNDLGNEFDINSPNFGEKYAPPYLPVGFYDWQGNQILRTHGDRFGKYNARLPSTITINVGMPSGVSPYMATACMNDAAKVDLGNGILERDPNFDPRYSQFCYTFQYMPGSTTYLDTPVLPISAFATTQKYPLDCELPQAMPAIFSVDAGGVGPFVAGIDSGNPGNQGAAANTDLTITADSIRRVRNPAYDGINDQFVNRDNGFGATVGTVTLTDSLGGTTSLSIVGWADGVVTATVPERHPIGDYQLTVETAGGMATPVGVTVTVANLNNKLHTVGPGGVAEGFGFGTIQDAIDAAKKGEFISIAPGDYDELVIMYKAVKLQGWGAYGTTINATKFPARKLQDWRDKVNALAIANGPNSFDPLPHQEDGFNQANNEPDGWFKEEGAAITVAGQSEGGLASKWSADDGARIDGIGITGASHGGGIFINGYTNYLSVSNNHIFGNQGTFGGGIRAGDSFGLPVRGDGEGAVNDNLNIHHNQIAQNGANGGSGAGISLYTGADDYSITENWICGNFSSGDGGGIGHQGLNKNGTIAGNLISFNQSFNQGTDAQGGGVSIAGIQLLNQAVVPPTPILTEGAGDVMIDSNVIIGNQAGAGDGGGLRTQFINGEAIFGVDPPGPTPAPLLDPYRIDVINNVIANNVAGLTGAGIALSDTINATIDNNTIVNNDSTATAGLAFDTPNSSLQQTGAGIASRGHSPALTAEVGVGFSNPMSLADNIIWHNRVFNWVTDIDPISGAECFHLEPFIESTPPASLPPGCETVVIPGPAIYSDLAVIPAALGSLVPVGGITDPLANPGFADPVSNGGVGTGIQQQELTTAIAVQPALDEGGNFIDLQFGPISMEGSGNYNEVDPSVGANGLGANDSRWQTGFKLAASIGNAGSAATASGSTNLSLSGVSSAGASGYGGVRLDVDSQDEEADDEAPAADEVQSITLDLAGISMNEQSN